LDCQIETRIGAVIKKTKKKHTTLNKNAKTEELAVISV